MAHDCCKKNKMHRFNGKGKRRRHMKVMFEVSIFWSGLTAYTLKTRQDEIKVGWCCLSPPFGSTHCPTPGSTSHIIYIPPSSIRQSYSRSYQRYWEWNSKNVMDATKKQSWSLLTVLTVSWKLFKGGRWGRGLRKKVLLKIHFFPLLAHFLNPAGTGEACARMQFRKVFMFVSVSALTGTRK